MKIRIVYWCDSGKKSITLYLRAEFTHRHRNSPCNIAVNNNRRLVLRDERTGHFLYGADYSTANGGFIGFISVLDELTSYDNATWMQLSLSQKCNILLWKVVRCFGRKNKNIPLFMPPRLMRHFLSLLTNFCEPWTISARASAKSFVLQSTW